MLHLFLTVAVVIGSVTNVNSFAINVTRKGNADHVTQATDEPENPETLASEQGTDRMAIVEGDMLLNDDRSTVINTWPMLSIPYVISPEMAYRQKDLTKAMAIVSSISCLTFHPRTTEDNYLNFIESRGCASYVGFQGGNQRVFIGPPCQMGNIVHEILHALGTTHEHTRVDRDEHITILMQNIKEGRESNFQKKDLTSVLKNPYDLLSIMHYGRFVFSRNGLPTIVTHAEEDEAKVKDMGQRFKVTQLDGQKLRTLYQCDSQPAKNSDVIL